MGTVTSHSSGMVRAQLSLGTVGGKRKRLTAYFHDQAAAQEWITEQRDRLRRGERGPSRLPLGDFLASWIDRESRELAPMTVRNYRAIIAALPPALATRRLGYLEVADVQGWVDGLTGSPRTVAWKRNMLRAALNDAIRLGHIDRNVAALARPPRQRRPRRKVVSAADCAAILAATAKADRDKDGKPVPWRYHAAVAVSIGCGLRQGELLGLTWGDIRADRIVVRQRLRRLPGDRKAHVPGEYVIVPGTKADAAVLEVPLPPFARAALDDWRRTQDAERRRAGDTVEPLDRTALPVFTTPKGGPVNGTSLTHHFQDILATAGLSGLAWKDMRTATAELLAAAKVEQTVARDYLRHASYATTADHYTGSDWRALEAAGAAIESAVAR